MSVKDKISLMNNEPITVDEFIGLNDNEVEELIGVDTHINILEGSIVSYEIIRDKDHFNDFLDAMKKHKVAQNQNRFKSNRESFTRHAIIAFDYGTELYRQRIEDFINMVFIQHLWICANGDARRASFENCKFKKGASIGGENNRNALELSFNECKVAGSICVDGVVSSASISNSQMEHHCGFNMCAKSCESMHISNSKLGFGVQNCNAGDIRITSSNISNIYINNVSVSNTFFISSCVLEKHAHASFETFILKGWGNVDFSKVGGYFSFKNTSLGACKINCKPLSESSYKCLTHKGDSKSVHETALKNLDVIYNAIKGTGENQYCLELEYLERKIELQQNKKVALKDKNFAYFPKWLINKFGEIFLAYFCKWERILLTSMLTILSFAVLYTFHPNKLLYAGSEKYTLSLLDMMFSGVLTFSKFAEILINSIYFSLITFVTIGYGDISPVQSGSFKLLAGAEGALGIILISFLTVSVVRRYAR